MHPKEKNENYIDDQYLEERMRTGCAKVDDGTPQVWVFFYLIIRGETKHTNLRMRLRTVFFANVRWMDFFSPILPFAAKYVPEARALLQV